MWIHLRRGPYVPHRSKSHLLLLEEHHLLLDEANLGLHYLGSHRTPSDRLDIVLKEVRLTTLSVCGSNLMP